MGLAPGNPEIPGESTAGVDHAFSLLAAGVQRQLWRMGWTHLRPIQVDAIRTITQSNRHCVIVAETASGKTEAAFLPILSAICDEPVGSVRAMYVGPLRALINDQFRRVEELCGYLEVPVYRWHGDVEVSSKNKLLRIPAGVLLITPESLESLFVNRSPQLPALFGGLRFVVIDEVHTFLGSERGLHLQSLLARLRHAPSASRPSFRVVALSATVGDMSVACEFVDRDQPGDVVVIQSPPEGKELRYRLHAYIGSVDDKQPEGAADDADHAELATMRQVAQDLVEHCRGSSNLVFTNAKSDLEIYADLCREVCRTECLPDTFLVHHGSLSKEIREDAEAEMKSGRPRTTLCSSTLELGIDIGSVRTVGQVGPPWSVAGFKQRLGRSGRRDGEPRVGRMYIVCRDLGAKAELLDRLHLELIQAVAVTELFLEDWVEPNRPSCCDLSTLTHQIISNIAETGGIVALELFDRLCKVGPFRHIEPPLFGRLLRCLASRDIVEQTTQGDLILGLLGERIRSERDFYAAFLAPDEFSVLHGERNIGTLPIRIVPQTGEHIILAGRRWRVTLVDLERAEVHVAPATGRKRPLFLGGPGEIHDRIRERMRDVLMGGYPYPYLNSVAAQVLGHARASFAETSVADHPMIAVSDRRTLWFTWAGTRKQTTLAAMFAAAGVAAMDRGIAVEVDAPAKEVGACIGSFVMAPVAAESIAAHVQPKHRRKYDRLLSDDLLDLAIVRDMLDVPGAASLCQKACTVSRENSS